MGWLFNSRWKTKQDVLDDWKADVENAGYAVRMSGAWAYVEKDETPADLIYVLVRKDRGEWGYKDQSVTVGPYCYTAPLWMVLKVYPVFKNNEFFLGWLNKYPKKAKVLLRDQQNIKNHASVSN